MTAKKARGSTDFRDADRLKRHGHADAPESRPVQGPELGEVIELAEVGGLHHRYVREAA